MDSAVWLVSRLCLFLWLPGDCVRRWWNVVFYRLWRVAPGRTGGKGRASGVGGLERQACSPGEDMEGGGEWLKQGQVVEGSGYVPASAGKSPTLRGSASVSRMSRMCCIAMSRSGGLSGTRWMGAE